MGLYSIILRPVRGTLPHGHVRPGTGLIVLGLFVLLLGLDGGGGAQHEDGADPRRPSA